MNIFKNQLHCIVPVQVGFIFGISAFLFSCKLSIVIPFSSLSGLHVSGGVCIKVYILVR